MILFISHASEDQPDFVRPLAEALRNEYEKVWYSEYVLTLGDSLLQKIDQGLSSCDYGVVVLSKYFFEKKWPRLELDGLFARETRTRKMILPIWKDIAEDEIRGHSPILASRLGISTTAGLSKVLEAIRIAISASEHGRNQSALDVATQRVQKFRQDMAEKRRAEQLLASGEGTTLVSAGIENLWQTIQSVLSTGADESAPVKFNFSKNPEGTMYVRTVRGMFLSIWARNSTAAIYTVLETKIFRVITDRFGQAERTPYDLYVGEFKPTFRRHDELAWIDKETSTAYSTDELAGHLVDLFVKHVEESISDGQ